MEVLFGFVVAVFALAGRPGPATLSLAATGAAYGPRRGLGYMAGITTGLALVMTIIATGVAGVLLALPGAAPIVTTVAGGYILYLAYRIATAPPLAEASGEHSPPSFVAGVLLSLVNPKAYAAMAALFSGFVLVDEGPLLDAVLKGVTIITIVITVNFAWLFIGAALTRFAREPRMNRAINVTFAVLLVVSVVFAVLF